MARHRRCIVVRGDREATRAASAAVVAPLDEVLRVDGRAPGALRRRLGQSFDAVVIDLHEGVDADVLGQAQGLVRGGGGLVLELPDGDPVPLASLAVPPHGRAAVGTRFWRRLERALATLDTTPAPLAPPPRVREGTPEQRAVVGRLAALFAGAPALVTLLADRGRGKSSALGLALANLTGRRVAVTAPSREAAAEILRFAPSLGYVEPLALIDEAAPRDVVVIDEAAQLPVPLLRAIVARHPEAVIAFATTTHGYEGTGRGFVLRFLDMIAREPRPLTRLSLRAPIRWDEGDPLERFVFDLLALDAEPAAPVRSTAGVDRAGPLRKAARSSPAPRVIDRDALAGDEPLLRSLFGLLVHAHYRTTPGDLARLLDAPNLAVHAVVEGGCVLAATLVAHEGGLSRADCEAYARGERRIRGHALADTLMTHAARPEAGTLSMVRSVRIVTHPALRRSGLARALVDHVHATYAPDLFGTLFGATAALVGFRRAVGYELVRLGAAASARAGEPSVVMVRPASPRGEALVAALRADLGRDLPIQLALVAAEGPPGLSPALCAALSRGLVATELDDAARCERVARYLAGPQTFEAAASALTHFVASRREAFASLTPQERVLLEARVLERRPWRAAARAAGYPSARAAMRALRPAIATLFDELTAGGGASRLGAMSEERFGLSDLTDDEQLAFGALLRAMVSMDGKFSDDERAMFRLLAKELGEDDFWAMLERASKEVTSAKQVIALADAVTRPQARELLFYGVNATAQAGGVAGTEGALLDELRKKWGLELEA